MSNLNSIFDTLRGWPYGSALEKSFVPDPNVASLVEGDVVKTEGRQLADAAVLKIVDDSLTTAPTLAVGDAGKAYALAGVGGDWSTFGIGDVVEWDGAAWNLIVAAVEAEVATGTRAVIIGASAAGDFATHEEKIAQYTKHTVELVCTAGGYTDCIPTDIGKPVAAVGSGDSGTLVSYVNATFTWIVDPDTPADVFQDADALTVTGGDGVGVVDTSGVTPQGGAWAFVVPTNGSRILITGTNGVYDGKYYDYVGTHAAGAWTLSTEQRTARVLVSKMSSGLLASARKDDAWLVIQGNDQWDAQMAGVVTCLKLNSGCAYKVQHDDADSLVAGTLLEAASGVLQARTDKWPVGMVIYTNGTAGSEGYVAVASF
jgi:hypothetical protein